MTGYRERSSFALVLTAAKLALVPLGANVTGWSEVRIESYREVLNGKGCVSVETTHVELEILRRQRLHEVRYRCCCIVARWSDCRLRPFRDPDRDVSWRPDETVYFEVWDLNEA